MASTCHVIEWTEFTPAYKILTIIPEFYQNKSDATTSMLAKALQCASSKGYTMKKSTSDDIELYDNNTLKISYAVKTI